MRVRLRRALVLLASCAWLLGAQEAVARYSPEVEADARRLFTRIMSPYCPGLTLTTCPSEGAVILKDSIRAELAAGRTSAQVMRGLEERFGEGIHASPPARGFGLVAWVTPFLLLLAAGIALTSWLAHARRRLPRTAVRASPPSSIEPADDDRLSAALREDG